MRYVLDCSVALKWFFQEPLSDVATRLLEQLQQGHAELVAPDCIVAELGHSCRKLVLRRKLLPRGYAAVEPRGFAHARSCLRASGWPGDGTSRSASTSTTPCTLRWPNARTWTVVTADDPWRTPSPGSTGRLAPRRLRGDRARPPPPRGVARPSGSLPVPRVPPRLGTREAQPPCLPLPRSPPPCRDEATRPRHAGPAGSHEGHPPPGTRPRRQTARVPGWPGPRSRSLRPDPGEQVLHAWLLREALDVLGSRWDRLPERQRPHYSPDARFRILRLRALLALSAVETARTFRVSTGTVLRWESEAQAKPDRETVGSLLKPDPPSAVSPTSSATSSTP